MSYLQKPVRLRHQYKSRKRQRGVVIVMALFIVALVATMAYAMMARLDRDTQRTQLILRDAQAEYYAQGSIAWAMDQLRNDWVNKKPKQLVDRTPIASGENSMQAYKISTTIYDIQGRYNINNVATPDGRLQFMRLLHVLAPTLSNDKLEEVTIAVADWIAPSTSLNQLAKYYLELKTTPYRPAHKPMVSATELRLVKGMTTELYNALQPYVVALPANVGLNVQSAGAPVYAILSPSMTLDTGNEIVRMREQKPFIEVDDFIKSDLVANHQVKPDNLVTVSTYFLVESKVSIEKQHVVLYTLLERTGSNDGKTSVHILWQSKGVW